MEIKPGQINSNFYLSELLYSYKYGYKDKYFKALEKLKPVMDQGLYNFLYNFGFNNTFTKRR